MALHRPAGKQTSDVVAHPTKRPLLLSVGETGGGYRLAARSDNAVYCVDCGGMMGDPFEGLTIRNGYWEPNAARWATPNRVVLQLRHTDAQGEVTDDTPTTYVELTLPSRP